MEFTNLNKLTLLHAQLLQFGKSLHSRGEYIICVELDTAMGTLDEIIESEEQSLEAWAESEGENI